MPDTRLLAVAELGLDRAWPELGPQRGAQRREQARTALVQLAEAARGFDALVVAGGLLDRRSVEPATVDLLSRLFEAIALPVVVAPGNVDWYSEDNPLATTDWPSNVRVVTDPSGERVELSTGLVVWACAVTSPLQPDLSVPGPGGPVAGGHVAVVPGTASVDDRDLDAAGVAHAVLSAVDVSSSTSRVTSTGHAVPAQLGGGWPSCAVSLTLDESARLVTRDVVAVAVPRLEVVELDAGDCRTSEALRDAVQAVADAGAAGVRLTGRLRPGVLLPHLLTQPAPDLCIDTAAVSYELAVPSEDDPTTASQFLRDLVERPGAIADRHQAAALGFRALDGARDAAAPVARG